MKPWSRFNGCLPDIEHRLECRVKSRRPGRIRLQGSRYKVILGMFGRENGVSGNNWRNMEEDFFLH